MGEEDVPEEMDEDDDDMQSGDRELPLFISFIVMMMNLFCSCYTVLEGQVSSGNYDHGATTTRAMRLRLPYVAGHVEILGTQAYRLLNWVGSASSQCAPCTRNRIVRAFPS